MKTNYKTGEEYYNKIYLYFNALIALSLTPFGYLLLVRQSGDLIPIINDVMAYYAVVIGLLIGMTAVMYNGHFGFENDLSTVDPSLTLREKLDTYMKVSMKKYFLFLLAGVIGVSGLYVTTSAYFIVAYILCVILLSFKRPTLNSIIDDLHLSEGEERILVEKSVID